MFTNARFHYLAVGVLCLLATSGNTQPFPGLVSHAASVSTSAAGASVAPVFSGDGRLLIFLSEARNLVTNDNRSPLLQVYTRDLLAHRTQLVSVNGSANGGGNGNAISPSVSSNGARVVFAGDADDLAGSDTNRATDIFLRDLAAGTTTLLSVEATGAHSGNGASTTPLISTDGRWVVFESLASDLVPGDENGGADIFARDLETQTTYLVSTNSQAAVPGTTSSGSPSIADDGQSIAFVHRGPVVFDGLSSDAEIYLADLPGGYQVWVSAGARAYLSGETNTYRCLNPAVSADGQTVAFLAARVPVQRTNALLFHYTRSTAQLVLVSSNALSLNCPQLSGDGRKVVYETSAGIELWDAATGQNTNLCLCGPGNIPLASCISPVLTRDGDRVAFIGTQGNTSGVYLFDSQTHCSRGVSLATNGQIRAAVAASIPAIDLTGTNVAFASPANDLAAGDLNLAPDVFMADSVTGVIRLISQRDPLLPAASGAPGLQDVRTFRSTSVSADGGVAAYGNGDPIAAVSDAKPWQDLFLADLRQGTRRPVSDSLAGRPALPNYAAAPMLSADGRYLAYLAPRETPPGTTATELVWLDSSTGIRKTFASSTSVPGQFGGTARRTVLSADGRFVAERSANPSNLSGLDRWDMFASVPTPEPIPLDGPQAVGNAGAQSPAFSPDGRWLLYLNPGVGLYVRDLLLRATRRVSDGPGFTGSSAVALNYDDPNQYVTFSADSRYAFYQPNPRVVMRHELIGSNVNTLVCTNCRNPSPSGNGRLVALEAPLLPVQNDVFVVDLETGQSNLVSVNFAGQAGGNGRSSHPTLSFDARYVVFASQASDLVPGDNNNASDIFVRDLRRHTTLLVSMNHFGTGPGNAASKLPVLTADGRRVFFQSFASDLVAEDYSRNRDLFVLRLGGADTDQDGLDDDWEMAYFGALSRDGSGDFDGDGLSDRQEYEAGTDPADGSAVFRVLTISAFGGSSGTLIWSASPGRRYRVQYKDGVDAGAWTELGEVVTAAGTTGSQIDSSVPAAPTRFYRVLLVP